MEICPNCQNIAPENAIFCPKCGKALKEVPVSIGGWKQAAVYAISFFLVPFGLIWAVKYLRSSDPAAKRVGYVCVALTVLAVVLTLVVTGQIISAATSMVSSYNFEQ